VVVDVKICEWVQFNKEEGKDVHEAKLKVVYVSPPQPPSPITESNEEDGNSPKASTPMVDNGERHPLLLDPVRKRRWHCLVTVAV
jgi:hypothetical protein